MKNKDIERQECDERMERDSEIRKKKDLGDRSANRKWGKKEERQRKKGFWRRSAMEFQANLLQSLNSSIRTS